MRKVLSFVLVLSLVLGSFSMAFAATPATGLSDIAGNANEEAIQVNFDLGIITGNPDGTFLPAKAVTRAEFAAMITRALAIPDSALAGYTSTSFKDTTGYGWAVPYLAFCNSKGIMLGDGNGNAMPGRTINTNEAVTMALRAIGYTSNSSELVGTWPANYVTLAQNKGLYDDVAGTGNVDKASAAQVIYNTLTVQKVAVNSDGETTFLDNGKVSTDPNYVAYNLLNTGLDCDENLDQIIDGNSDSVININKYIGQHGTTYTNDDDEIVAFISDSTQLIGTFEGGANFDDDFETLGDVDYTNNATTAGIELMYNGTDENCVFSPTTVFVVNADVSGKKISEIYSVMEWNTESFDDVVSASDLGSIEDDQSLLGVDFALDDDDEIDYSSFALVGVASLADIKADNVVYVYENDDNEISRIEVGTKVVEGVVKSVKSGDITIGSTVYANASAKANVGNETDVTTAEVSKNVKASLDVNGYIYDVEVTDDVANNVAVLLAKDAGIDNQAKLLSADASEKVYSVKNSTVYGQLPALDNLLVYGLNKDGKVSSVTDGGAYVTLAAGNQFKSNSVVSVGALTYRVASDVVVYAKNAAADYDVTTIADVTKDPLTAAGQLLLDDTGKVIGIIIDADDASASAADVYGVLNEEYPDTDADGDKVMKLEGFADGATFEKLTDSDTTVLTAAIDNTFATLVGVQIYKFEIDADGVVTLGDAADGDLTSVVINATVGAVDGRNAIKSDTGTWYALAEDVAIYEFVPADNEYKAYSGKLLAGWHFSVYEHDDDTAGSEIVVFIR